MKSARLASRAPALPDRCMWAVVPAKDLSRAKNRLSGALSPHERRDLFYAMLGDVLDALGQVRRLGGILVVTRDPQAARLANRADARLLVEEQNEGQSRAVGRGAAALRREGVRGIIALPGDVPLIAPEEVDEVLAAHGAPPAVTLVPDRLGRGSNAVVCSPPDLIPFCFGEDSFSRHQLEARRVGIEPRVVKQPGIGLDIDTPGDLRALIARPARTRAHQFLTARRIHQRLKDPRAPGGAKETRRAKGRTP